MPSSAFVGTAILVVGPKPWRQINVAARNVFHQRGDQNVGTEKVLVLDQPGGRVLGVLEEQGTQHWVAFLGAQLGLGIDVGHQLIFELYYPPELICKLLAVLPGLFGGCAVAAAM